MASPGYIVVRLVPSAPVDGGTFFSDYLEGLQLRVFDATGQVAYSDPVYCSPLSLLLWPPGVNAGYITSSLATSAPTTFDSGNNNYGKTLTFDSTDGIPAGAYVFSSDLSTIPGSAGLSVVDVTDTTVTLNSALPNYVPAATPVVFLCQYPNNTLLNPSNSVGFSFSLNANSAATKDANGNLTVLHFADASGVTLGMQVGAQAGFIADGTTVVDVEPQSPAKPTTVTVSPALLGSPTSVTFTLPPPFASLTLIPTGNPSDTELDFASNGATGVAHGMTLSPQSGPVKPGTTVKEVTPTKVILSNTLSGAWPLASKQPATFTFPLSFGIVQHVTYIPYLELFGIDIGDIAIPAAVATAIIPLANLPDPVPEYVNVTIQATRDGGTDVIPINTVFYNVLVENSAPPPPYLYQSISSVDTSLYLTLPPQPTTSPIELTIPSDGSPPPYQPLVVAIMNALIGDPVVKAVTASTNADCSPSDSSGGTQLTFAGTAQANGIAAGMLVRMANGSGSIVFGTTVKSVSAPTTAPTTVTLSAAVTTDIPAGSAIAFLPPTSLSNLTTDQCQAIAYNIAWSYQNTLPAPPDPLESLYTDPPNAGNSSNTSSQSSSGGDTNNSSVLEQDRQKFEGTLNSFYSTRNANAERLCKFVAAAAAAVYCEQTSLQSATALLQFPVDPSSSFATAVESELLLGGIGVGAPSKIHFGVPAAFFYALHANLDKSTTAAQRFQLATGDAIERLLQALAAAVDAGVITAAPQAFTDPSVGNPIASFQAARRLVGLGVSGASTTPATKLVAGNLLAKLVGDWLATGDPTPTPPPNPPQTYEEQDFAIWTKQLAQNEPQAYLTLDLEALTQGDDSLVNNIIAWLPSTTDPPTPKPTVETLKSVTAAQWTTFFNNNPTWLPPFTAPVAAGSSYKNGTPASGYIATRIRAFIRAVQQFFTVSSIPTTYQPQPQGAPPIFALPAFDPFNDLPAGFKFGSTLSSSDLNSTVTAAFPDDPTAQAWLSQAITSINELYEIASVVPNPPLPAPSALPYPVNLAFSVMEALYARGFRSAKDITALAADDFQQALIGTVAYDYANTATNSLYQAAQKIAPFSAPAGNGSGEAFQPVNPDGALTNCVPPPCLSPTGAIAYLHELLQLSEAATCHDPGAAPAGASTLGNILASRRGPLGNLMATGANLETPLPLIDIVNECLEYLGAASTPSNGTIYDTAYDHFAGLDLCRKGECADDRRGCHDPEAVFGALPEHSTPAAWAPKNPATQPAAYGKLKVDFSSCHLPYSQALDVSRTYLRHFGSSRFEETRTFRKCITEFALYPINPPSDFRSYLWRFPVRIETAIEYLGITPEEYAMLFQGTPPLPCLQSDNQRTQTVPPVQAWQLYGYASPGERNSWLNDVQELSEFLPRTCLTWCDFLDLSQAVLPQFALPSQSQSGANPSVGGQNANPNDTRQRTNGGTAFPRCEPCCLKNYRLGLPEGDGLQQSLVQIAVFIRLWRKLKEACRADYTFEQFWDICTVLNWSSGGNINPEFIRQLAAFQMLRDYFELPLTDRADQSPTATGADRTQLLSLWVGSSAKKWRWAVDRLLEGVDRYARKRLGCEHPLRAGVAGMAENLDALSSLAGFNPSTPSNPSTDIWNSQPTCTLRFAEVLAKMHASRFSIEELLYLFNAEPPHGPEDLFAFQDADDALNYPLDLPERDERDSLWRLREALLAVEIGEHEVQEWTWPRVVAEFRNGYGYAPPAGQDPLLSIGQHFFPDVLEAAGFSVSAQQRQYHTALTSTANWNTSPGSPFRYDAGASPPALWTQLPLRDEAVAAKLSELPQLSPAEQAAVQDLYFAPRLDLACAAFLFPDWRTAEINLIEEREEAKRWAYFRRHVALAHARRKVINAHLARHVRRRTAACDHDHLEDVAALILSRLFSDENTGTPWESDSGVPPTVMWTPPAGGAVVALLGLAGTGLLGEYKVVQPANNQNAANGPGSPAVPDPTKGSGISPASLQLVWRDVRGPLQAFGHERDVTDGPVPTIVPALGLTPPANPAVVFQNGYAVRASDGRRLGGAQGFQVCWSGVLLVEREGEYAFHAGSPTPEGERPDFERAEKSQWRVTLKRGQKSWVVLNHQWPGETDTGRHVARLRRGAHYITVEFAQPEPDFATELRPQQTSFQLKYAGPDSDGCLIVLPLRNLYRDIQDQTLDQGVQFLTGSKNAQAFLKAFYTPSLRDIRRTYQRAFKVVLFAGGLGLSARPVAEAGQSELGYMLSNPQLFAGWAAYRTGPDTPTGSSPFHCHLAYFDLNYLPLQDDYFAPKTPPSALPDRSHPSLQRRQALFDIWEHIADYGRVRRDVARRCKAPVWLLFNDALVQQPTDAAQLLRHIGADSRYWDLDLRFYQDQASPIYSVSDTDLAADGWLVRVWHADRWNRALIQRSAPRHIDKARPDLWAALDPAAPVNGSKPGNANLLDFVLQSCLDGEPRRYADLKRLDDGLRERGRDALLHYLCAMDRVTLNFQPGCATVPQDISNLLLIDVGAGICEKASRIEEAITAVQTFIRRARLGLEPNWKITREFARLWDSRFATYRIWEQAKRRDLYGENWIDWTERARSRRIEAFRFLESQLHSSTLTLAAPGGLDWWVEDDMPLDSAPKLLQRRNPSELNALSPLPPPSATREGLGTLGSPEHPPLPTWLTPVPQAGGSSPPDNPNRPGFNQPGGNSPNPNQPGASQPAVNPSPENATVAGQPSVNQPAKANATQPQAASGGNGAHHPLPLWMQSAMQMGTRFVRVAAAGVPQAALGFVPHRDQPHGACCDECGCEHPILADEYYFWLVNTEFYSYTDQTDSQNGGDPSFQGSYQDGFQDSYWDSYQQQSTEWNDENVVPQLLAKWQPNPAVRLAWCRVHDGEFGQPRRSDEYVQVAPGGTNPPDLIFLGRGGDSLYFTITDPASLPPGYGDSTQSDMSPPGFRYDLPWDQAIALPQVLKPPALPAPSPYPGGLNSYPYFAYHEPGARLFPYAWFAPAISVAEVLRTHCRFELALRWYARAFDPLKRDCTWMRCPEQDGAGNSGSGGSGAQSSGAQAGSGTPVGVVVGVQGGTGEEATSANLSAAAPIAAPTTVVAPAAVAAPPANSIGACCDSALASEAVARDRSIVLHYCQTLVDWGDACRRRGHSPEAFAQARLTYDTAARILGPRPATVMMGEPEACKSVSAFVPAFASLNPRLLDLYDLVADRLGLIHACDAQRLRNGRPCLDMPYFGNEARYEMWRMDDPCAEALDWCHQHSPYRFTALIQKGIEIAGRLAAHGAALQAAYEKGEAEYLSSMRAEQERELLAMALSIRQDQWRDADWQVQALQKTKDVNQTNLIYYNTLYQNGLINDEIQNLNLATNAIGTKTAANITEAFAEAMKVIPDIFVGFCSTDTQVPVGTKLAGVFETVAKVMQTIADIQTATAAIDSIQAGYDRRSVDWFHQTVILPIDIEQIELQKLGAHRRRDQALKELNNQQRQIENAVEIENFLRDKLMTTDMYLWQRTVLTSIYFQTYQLTYQFAQQLQHKFNFELGHLRRNFLPENAWDDLRAGFLAGERLELALRHMEKAYLDENTREYELTKHFSLRLHFPLAFLRLKATGSCEIDIPEAMFDVDYPGFYMRRIRGVTLTIPCVTGPYTGVHCRLTLLSSVTRTDPRLAAPPHECCCPPRQCCCEDDAKASGYALCPDDPRAVRHYGAREAIATSSGQNDSGMFEFSFHDERYLPFEYYGAVSRWRIELPQENNFMPLDTMTDVDMLMYHTAREGGELLCRAASEAARCYLPGDGWVYSDVRHDFPDAWQLFRDRGRRRDAGTLDLPLRRDMFPYIPFHRDLEVSGLVLMFETAANGGGDCHEIALQPGCHDQDDDHGERFGHDAHNGNGHGGDEWHDAPQRHDGDHREHDAQAYVIRCLRSCGWPKLYHGACDVALGRIGREGDRRHVTFRFPREAGRIERVYVFWRYDVAHRPDDGRHDEDVLASFGAPLATAYDGDGQPEDALT